MIKVPEFEGEQGTLFNSYEYRRYQNWLVPETNTETETDHDKTVLPPENQESHHLGEYADQQSVDNLNKQS